MTAPAWRRLGDRAVRFARPPGVGARAIVRAARAWPGVVDVVVAMGDVAVYFDAPVATVDGARIAGLAQLGDDGEPAREVELRAVYDGADLDELSRELGVDVAAIHATGAYRVESMGFQPGFAYLVGLDARIAAPRLATPRARVPAGAIGIAGELTGVYPAESPGGWRLIGRVVDAPMLGDAGPRLELGDRVRFVR
jgi:UPF0271 protein|nr:carboxyltransferase domain-containing protein [Kofleriaceae bacterium]